MGRRSRMRTQHKFTKDIEEFEKELDFDRAEEIPPAEGLSARGWGNIPTLEMLFKEMHPESKFRRDARSIFFLEISNYRLLTRAEQMALVLRYKKYDDIGARNRLICHNIKLVLAIANRFKYRKHRLDYLDLIQEGVIGMMRAIELYDYTRGYAFSTYASWWIRQYISRSIMNFGQMIRIPVHKQELWNKLILASMEIVEETGKEPLPEQLGEKLGLAPSKVARELRAMQMNTAIYLDDRLTINLKGDSLTVGEKARDRKPNPFELLILNQELEESFGHIDRLADMILNFKGMNNSSRIRNFEIFERRYGILDASFTVQTLESVAKKFGITRERVRQIIQRVWGRFSRINGYDETWFEGELYKIREISKAVGYDRFRELLVAHDYVDMQI